MSIEKQELVSASTAARSLGVPQKWLKEKITREGLPHLMAGARVMVHLPTIRALLVDIASTPSESSPKYTVDSQSVGSKEQSEGDR